MSDQIGRIVVPTPVASGLTFPLKSEYGYGETRDWSVVSHRFAALSELSTQRFSLGSGARKFQFVKSSLSITDRSSLLDFYNSVQGSFQSFTYSVPNPDRTTFTDYSVIFDTAPLSITDFSNRCQAGIQFTEVIDPSSAPTYTVASTVTRFPSTTLATALQSQVQQIIPLIHIKVRDSAVPDIYLSDRRCTVGGQLYLPRVLYLGESGSDIVMSQDISGKADNVRFVFGNADRVMSKLAKDTSLKFASIDLCLYHINSQILLQLWKGIVISWQVDGSTEFSLQCTDGIYPITQSYPRRTVTRQCWKTFNDGLHCPWSTKGAGGNPASCDYFFNSPNGCLSHGMSPYFGGHPAFPQSVVIKDNGTGIIGGIGRSVVTSTSIVSDSIWGNPLPEIWCNDDGDPRRAFYANCMVAAVRDESDFEDVLGIVGVGPLGGYEGMSVQTTTDGYKFIVSPLADGFPPQGFKVNSQLVVTGYQPTFGLREVPGNDPVTPGTSIISAADQFSLGQGTPQHWDIPDLTFGNIPTGVGAGVYANKIFPYAAGTAFVELRYSKPSGSGLTPTTAESHSMVVPISKGITGYKFDSGGGRSAVAGLTNPFWVAVNTYLRAVGMEVASATDQLAQIVLSALTDGSGNGCAEIADLSVHPIIGDIGSFETQFRFQGMLAEFKPFRDWLTEILTCALGYFTFEFGKLRLGIRENASATAAFTLGNMLYQSLSVQPADATFEYLKIDFANRDLQYQQDMAEYQDKDHAAYYGRQGAPLTSRQRNVGLSTLSQALRVGVTRVREEIGGILRPDQPNPYIEFDNNSLVVFKSTILALDTYVGQVVNVTHPDIPTYPGDVGGVAEPANTWKYRITRWTLHKDWSITIQGKSVTGSMYDLDVGPKPADVTPLPLPVLFYPEPLGQWAPYQIQADAADALFPNEWTFDLEQQYTTLTDGSAVSRVVAIGKLPVNSFIPNCGAPDVKKGSITQSTSGGSLPGGTTYYVQVCATDVNGRYSPPSDVLIIQIPAGTNTNQFTLSGIVWPNASGLTGYTVFAATSDDLICGQQTGALSGIYPSYSPTSIPCSGPFARSTYSVPNTNLSKVRLKGRRLIHGGVLGAGVTSLTSTTITSSDTIDGTAADAWTGRVLAIIGRATAPGSAPFSAFNISGFNAATGVFTLDRNPVTAGVAVDDTLVVCFLGTDNSGNPYVISDPGLSNITNGHSGETVNDPNRIGNFVLVIKGLSRGRTAKITANTSTSYTLDQPLPINATSVWVVVTAAWEYTSELPLDNADPTKATQISMDVTNYNGLPMLIGATLVDTDADESPDLNLPVRMIWIEGHAGGIVVPTTPGDPTFTPLLSEYGTISVDNVSVAAPLSLSGIDWLLYYVDELTADVFVTTNTSSGTSDPLTIATTDNPNLVTPTGTLGFAIGDYVLWNDNGHYEISKITNITGSAPSRTFTLSRASSVRLGSSLASHASNTQLFKLQLLRDMRNSQTGGFSGGVPDTFKFILPSACVAAIVGTAYISDVFSGSTTVNLATASLPGIRTCTGATVIREKAGTLAVAAGVNVFSDLQIPSSSPYRVGYMSVGTAPTGSSLKVNIRVSVDDRATWQTVEQLVIAVGTKENWSGGTAPSDKQQPYSGAWPFQIWRGGYWLNASIEQVGSTIAGADLSLSVAI